MQWVQKGPGAEGTLTVWLEDRSLALLHGELVQPSGCARPWERLACTVLPKASHESFQMKPQLSPDLSKVFLVEWTQREEVDEVSGDRWEVACTVRDTFSGEHLWKDTLPSLAEEGCCMDCSVMA